MAVGRRSKMQLVKDIVGRLMRLHSTAGVLLHHAVAERLGLGPTDHKCLDLLRERGGMTGAELAEITGLTSGAITGVVVRLEREGYLRRKADPHDGRKQLLQPVTARFSEIHDVFGPLHADLTDLLDTFDAHQLSAIADFLLRSAQLTQRHARVLRIAP